MSLFECFLKNQAVQSKSCTSFPSQALPYRLKHAGHGCWAGKGVRQVESWPKSNSVSPCQLRKRSPRPAEIWPWGPRCSKDGSTRPTQVPAEGALDMFRSLQRNSFRRFIGATCLGNFKSKPIDARRSADPPISAWVQRSRRTKPTER